MAKLSQIIDPFANALGIQARSLNVLAMVLRKSGLITKGGRGPAGAEMGCTDATNIILAAMIGGEATSADKWVHRMRSAKKLPPHQNDGAIPKVTFLRETLGETLDALIGEFVEQGGPLNPDTELPITNLRLTVDKPSDFCCSAELWIDDGDTDGTARFHRNSEAFDGLDISKLSKDETRAIVSTLRRPRMHVRASIGSDELFEIAEIIGGPFPEFVEDVPEVRT